MVERSVNNKRARRRRAKSPFASIAMPVAKQRCSRSKPNVSDRPVRPGSRESAPLKIPEKAPEFWPGRCHTDEDIADFTRRVWGSFLDAGLKLGDIEKRDVKLYNAIRNYQSVEGKPWPKDLARLSERGRLAEAMDRAQREGVRAVTPKELMAIARKLARQHAPG